MPMNAPWGRWSNQVCAPARCGFWFYFSALDAGFRESMDQKQVRGLGQQLPRSLFLFLIKPFCSLRMARSGRGEALNRGWLPRLVNQRQLQHQYGWVRIGTGSKLRQAIRRFLE